MESHSTERESNQPQLLKDRASFSREWSAQQPKNVGSWFVSYVVPLFVRTSHKKSKERH